MRLRSGSLTLNCSLHLPTILLLLMSPLYQPFFPHISQLSLHHHHPPQTLLPLQIPLQIPLPIFIHLYLLLVRTHPLLLLPSSLLFCHLHLQLLLFLLTALLIFSILHLLPYCPLHHHLPPHHLNLPHPSLLHLNLTEFILLTLIPWPLEGNLGLFSLENNLHFFLLILNPPVTNKLY